MMKFKFSEKYGKYGKSLNSQDWYKFVAVVIMTIDHLGLYLFPECLWLRAIGRITFPVWFFLAGYSRNLKIKSDIIILAGLMILAKAYLINSVFPLNALVSIILIRLIIRFLDDRNFDINKNLANIAITLIFLVIPSLSLCEYGTQGLLYGFMGYMVKNGYNKNTKQYLFFLVTLLVFLAIQSISFNFNIAQHIFVWTGTAYVTWKLSDFKIKELPYFKKISALSAGIKLFSRYSLYYYFLHIIFLQMLAGKYFMDERFQIFKWLD